MEENRKINNEKEDEFWTTEEVEIAIDFVKKPLYQIIKLLSIGYVVILAELIIILLITR